MEVITLPATLDIDLEVFQNARRHAFPLAYQSEEDMLGADIFVVEALCLLPRHLQDFPNALREVVPVHDILILRVAR